MTQHEKVLVLDFGGQYNQLIARRVRDLNVYCDLKNCDMTIEEIKEYNPIRFNDLCLSGKLWTCLADLNEQAQNRLELIIEQMKATEGITEVMKQHDQMAWIRAMNSICNRAEKIIIREMIYEENVV